MKRVPLSKSIFLFPSLCTTGSIFAGFFAILKSISGEYTLAVVAIFTAGFLDLIDGRLARMTKTQTDFGMEYDSLADVVSFGIAPAILIYTWGLQSFYRIGWMGAFVYVACGALRLARFNVQILSVEKKRFQGLPIPMAAGVVTSYVLFSPVVFGESVRTNYGALLLAFVVAPLMVSNVRYRSFKDLDLKGRRAFYALLVVIGIILLIGSNVRVMPFLAYFAYMISGPIEEVFLLQRRREKQPRRLTSRKMTVLQKVPEKETMPWPRS